jgi:virginiamycin B lyase
VVQRAERPQVGRVTTAGQVTEYAVPGVEPLPGPIVAGPDGALYISEHSTGKISRMTFKGRSPRSTRSPGGFN